MPSSKKSRIRYQRPKMHFQNITWGSAVGIVGLHAGCLLAPFAFSWSAVGVAVFLWWLAGGLGVTLCFHRLLTHRSFETPKIVEYLLTVFGSLNWQGGHVRWVGTHRLHHRDSDTESDPHSPRHGFNWAHVLWCFVDDPLGRNPRELAKDLQRDPVHNFLDRYFALPQLALAPILYALGGWPWVVWGICVRTVASYHATWFVNSAAHTWGYRNFETGEDSRNNWWVALISFGEGWHNNHHAFARSARHGMRWWELDLTYLTIRLMGKLGLAWNIHIPQQARAGKA
ncbi:MAG: acyl-CoA desaturase [Acidobacteriota bacterium]